MYDGKISSLKTIQDCIEFFVLSAEPLTILVG